MKVEIINCSRENNWYQNKIGEVFNVEDVIHDTYGYILDGSLLSIAVSDAQIIENNKPFPIPHNSPVLARDGGQWFPVVFDELTDDGFRCYSSFSWGNRIAPDFIHPPEIAQLEGNEKMIHQEGDVFELWDAERVEREIKG